MPIDPTLVLYRFWDGDGRLLYIGKTIAVRERMNQHRRTADFFSEVASITFERGFKSDHDLCRAETAAIQREHPVYNVVDNPVKRPPKAVDPWMALHRILDRMGRALHDGHLDKFEALGEEHRALIDAQWALADQGDEQARSLVTAMVIRTQEHHVIWTVGVTRGWDFLWRITDERLTAERNGERPHTSWGEWIDELAYILMDNPVPGTNTVKGVCPGGCRGGGPGLGGPV